MPGSPAEVKLVSNAMANATRRKIMAMLVEKERTRVEVEQAAGGSMLDYHLQMLQQAGLADMKEGRIILTDFGKNFMETKAEKPAEAKKDLAGTRPLEVVQLRQLLPCIADSTKFRIIARLEPPSQGQILRKDRGAHHSERQCPYHPLLYGQCHHDHDHERGAGPRDSGGSEEDNQ
jgi:DNA-binding transcriptional ArsR family regulator